MWEKASKKRKTDELSTPNQTSTTTNACTSPVNIESNLQLVLWQEPESRAETSTPHEEVEDDESIDEDDERMRMSSKGTYIFMSLWSHTLKYCYCRYASVGLFIYC